MLENLGAKLKSARNNAGLSRQQVADLVGVSSSIIGLYETGERLPSVTNLVKLATQYKVSVDYLLDIATSKDIISLDGLSPDQIQGISLLISHLKIVRFLFLNQFLCTLRKFCCIHHRIFKRCPLPFLYLYQAASSCTQQKSQQYAPDNRHISF